LKGEINEAFFSCQSLSVFRSRAGGNGHLTESPEVFLSRRVPSSAEFDTFKHDTTSFSLMNGTAVRWPARPEAGW
jgi:hypothetical protein